MTTFFRQKFRDVLEYMRVRILSIWHSGTKPAGSNYKPISLISLHFIVFVIFAVACLIGITSWIVTSHYNSEFKVLYSLDRRENDKEIIKLIDDADKYVYFAIYFFTKNNIADALIKAKKRGIVVWGISDAVASEDSNKNNLEKLREAGITVETQKHQDGIMHMKVLVTEKAFASGSYNWTAGATNINDEVLEVSANESLRRKYLEIVKKVLLANQ